MIKRQKEKNIVKIGKHLIGGQNPIVVQSMTNTDTHDVKATLNQIEELAKAGCEIVRLAIPSKSVQPALVEIAKKSPLPLVADIHFDHRLALMALDAGFDALRINPGNIIKNTQNINNLAKNNPINILAKAILDYNVSVRVGVNSGSVEKDLWEKYGGPVPMALVESALRHTSLLEERGVTQIKVSLKSSSVLDTIAAYKIMHEKTNYPLHLGVTEAGTVLRGAIKSAIGIGNLLMDGIGDTVRVSLTASPLEEIVVAYDILRATGHRAVGVEIISCPTCGRTEINLIELAKKIEEYVKDIRKDLKIAVMGCVVNGPGEAREADLGLAGGRDKGVIFKKGQVVKTVQGEENLLKAFLAELDTLL